MNDGLIPRRYAKALYKYALENGDADVIYEQLKVLNFSYSGINALKKVMLNPHIPDNDKSKTLLAAAGAKPGSSLDRFILLVLKNNRAEFLRRIALSYVRLYREEHNIAKVEIVMATQLPAEEIEAITDIVKRELKGMTLEISELIDPEIIGGFKVVIDSLVLDASVKNELQQLRLKLQRK